MSSLEAGGIYRAKILGVLINHYVGKNFLFYIVSLYVEIFKKVIPTLNRGFLHM